MTVAKLSHELGVDAGDLHVMIAALGECVDDELTPTQAADLLDVLDARFDCAGSTVRGRPTFTVIEVVTLCLPG